MKILALESSAQAASAAVCEDEFLIGQFYQNTGLTHSRTLLPMADRLLEASGLTLGDIDVIAVAAGPGSFTGLRIGVAAAKGLGWALEKPCAKVSTLAAMAWNAVGVKGELCPVMDARRSQVYNARFTSDGETVVRLREDRAIGLDALAEDLADASGELLLVGDGAELCYRTLEPRGFPLRLAPPHMRYQSAWGVARAGLELARSGNLTTAADLAPDYHRSSQAERERLEKENGGK